MKQKELENAELEIIQNEVASWYVRKFPNQDACHSMLAIVEEFGELVDAHHSEDVQDAIGDILIAMTTYCINMGWSLPDIFQSAKKKAKSSEVSQSPWLLSILGNLSRATLKAHPDAWLGKSVRGKAIENNKKLDVLEKAAKRHIIDLMSIVLWRCNEEYLDPIELLKEIWKEVRNRSTRWN